MKFKGNGFFKEIIDMLDSLSQECYLLMIMTCGFGWVFCTVSRVFRGQNSYRECAFVLTGHAFYHTDTIHNKNPISESVGVKLKIYLDLL